MSVEAAIALLAIVLGLIVGGSFGFAIGKKREGDRWSKSASTRLIEFEKNLYEVNTVDLEKPITYAK